jgi:WD40 repeat protein
VHRDFKPENVMLTRAGRVVVMDFGLAKARSERETGTIAGTPAYMAPEQARGEAVDARADVYAAGVVLAEMLSVGGAGSAEARQAFWRSVRQVPPGVPDGPWAPVLRQALAANPEDRLGSARALAHALEEVTQRLPGVETRRPYPGLSSFTEEDAEFFFGRELEVEAVWNKLRRPRMLALIAPSGAGKSSFLRAGLLPTLPRGWKALVATPGNRPFQSLAHALAPAFAGDAQAVQALLRFEDADTAVSLLQRFRQRHEHALVILDQFEELFTLSPPVVQQAFAGLLGRLVLEADLHVILSLRDDFLFRCQDHVALVPAFSDLTPLPMLGSGGLRRALVQPALACGYRFEDEALVDEMVAEVRKEKGALPLIAFAASRLWEARDREQGLLTREAYQEIGGVAGALAQHAEATLERIGAQRTPLVREIFRNLVTGQGTRAVRERRELLSVFEASGSRGEAEEVLNALVDARLLTSYERAGDAGESYHQVEIVHESLLQAWPRLVRWQTQDADGVQLRDQLRQAAQLWQDRGKAEDLLWSGTAYQDFALWRARYPGGLTVNEEAFAEAATRRAGRRRRQRQIAVATVVATLALGLGVVAALWSRAESARQKAVAETLRSEASKLLVLGEREFERYPTGALAYAMKGLEVADTQVGRLLALRVLQHAPVARLAPLQHTAVTGAFSPDGRWIAVGGFGTVGLLRQEGGGARLLGEFTSKGNALAEVQFGPASDVALAVYRGDVRHWSVPEGRELRRERIETTPAMHVTDRGFYTETVVGTTTRIRFWPFGEGESRAVGAMQDLPGAHAFAFGWLAYARDRRIFLRSLETWRSPPRLVAEGATGLEALELSADGKRLAASAASGEVRLWSTEPVSPRPQRVLRAPGTPWPLLDRSGRWFGATGQIDGRPTVRLVDLTTPSQTEPLVLTKGDGGNLGAVTIDPAGQWLASLHTAEAALWWLGGAHPRLLAVPEAERGIASLAFSPDGRWLLSVSGGGVVRAWPMVAGEEPRVLLQAGGNYRPVLAVHPSGQQVVVGLAKGRLWLIPLAGGPPRALAGFSEQTGIGAVAFGDGGRLLAVAPRIGPREEKVVRVIDVETGGTRVLGPLPGAGEGLAGSVLGLSFSGVEHLLASVTGTGLVSIDLRDGSNRVVAAQPDGQFRLGPDARAGVGVHARGKAGRSVALFRFDLDGGAPLPLTSHGAVDEVALDPSGAFVASGSPDGTVRIGPISGAEPHVFLGHKSGIMALAFSPDGRWLASTAQDLSVRLWPVPDLTKTPLHQRPYEELMAVLRSHTNLRAVPDPQSATGYKLEPGPFPGWARPPDW